MAQQQMFSAMNNSPVTILTEALNSSGTTMTVDNPNVFPEAPNLAVLGSSDNAEIVKYTKISGNVLSIVRGQHGTTPGVWSVGTAVARNFTALDHDLFKENIEDLASSLAGKQDTLTFDTTPTANSTNPVTSGGVKTALDGKQDTLTFDTTPTANSTNPVTSGGVKTALDDKYFLSTNNSKRIRTIANDTVANWRALKNSVFNYTIDDELTDKPSNYGILINNTIESEVSQIWFTQPSGKIYRRSGNHNGWATSWVELPTERDIPDNIVLYNKNIVILGDSNAYGWQNSGLPETIFKNCTIQKLAVGGAGFGVENNSILTQYDNIIGTPDYIFIWCGNNDIAAWVPGRIGTPKFGIFDSSAFDTNTAFGAQNKLLCNIRNDYPNAKVLGVIRTTTRGGRNPNRSTYFWYEVNEIFKKWNTPVIDAEIVSNITESNTTSFNTFFSDTLHYNTAGLTRFTEMIAGAIRSNLVCSVDLITDNYYCDDLSYTPKGANDPRVIQWIYENCIPFWVSDFKETRLIFAWHTNRGMEAYIGLVTRYGQIITFDGDNLLTLHTYVNGDWKKSPIITCKNLEAAANMLTLPDGDYMIPGSVARSMANYPSGEVGGCYLEIRTYPSGLRQYKLSIYGGCIYTGYINQSEIVWAKFAPV